MAEFHRLDPYAPSENEKKATGQAGREAGNAYDSFQGLLALARLTSSNASETRGACKKCGRIGNLTFQCRNFLSLKDDLVILPEPENERKEKEKDIDRMDINGGGDKIPVGENEGNLGSEENDDSTYVTDSSEDSEMERIIAKRFGRKFGKPSSRVLVKKTRVSSEDDCAEGRQRRRRRRGKNEKGRVFSKVLGRSRVSDEEVEDSDSGGTRRRCRKRKSRASSKNSGKTMLSSDDECEGSGREARRRRRKREISISSKKHDKSRDSAYEEGDYDYERDERSRSRRRKCRVSKKYRVSRVSSYSEDSEHEDREMRNWMKSRRSSNRGYSGGFSSDSEGDRSRRRKRREHIDESSYYSSDEGREQKRSKRRRVEYSDYSEDERRRRNGSCSTGSNSDPG